MTALTETTLTDAIRERIAEHRAEHDARPVARIVENLGRVLVEFNAHREPLPSEGYAVKRIAELVEDGFRIEDPDHLLGMWASFCDEFVTEADANMDAAGYPDTPLTLAGRTLRRWDAEAMAEAEVAFLADGDLF